LVKKFVTNPAKIKRAVFVEDIRAKGTQGITQKTKLVRSNNRAVPINPQGSRNNPRSGNFATLRPKNRNGVVRG